MGKISRPLDLSLRKKKLKKEANGATKPRLSLSQDSKITK